MHALTLNNFHLWWAMQQYIWIGLPLCAVTVLSDFITLRASVWRQTFNINIQLVSSETNNAFPRIQDTGFYQGLQGTRKRPSVEKYDCSPAHYCCSLQEKRPPVKKYDCLPIHKVKYRTDFISPRKNIVFCPAGWLRARKISIYLWGAGLKYGDFLAYFGACQTKIPVRGWCKLNIPRVRGWCGSVILKYCFGAADWTQVCMVSR